MVLRAGVRACIGWLGFSASIRQPHVLLRPHFFQHSGNPLRHLLMLFILSFVPFVFNLWGGSIHLDGFLRASCFMSCLVSFSIWGGVY